MKADEYLKERKIKDIPVIPDYPTETGYFLSQIMEDYAEEEVKEEQRGEADRVEKAYERGFEDGKKWKPNVHDLGNIYDD